MKLSYRILWFDDQFKYVEKPIKRLESYILKHGFEPSIDRKNGITEDEIDELSESLSTYNPYDIIFFDYDLGRNSETGLSIASKLRNRIYTDLIFYSGKEPDTLRKMLYEEKVDGVFIVHREHFYDDVALIVDDHIKRMSDINNIRGVTMSAMSGVDNDMRNLFSSKVKELDACQKESLLADIKRRLNEKIDKQLKKIDGLDDVCEAALDHLITDFEAVRILMKSLYKKEERGHEVLNEKSKLYAMQKERNNLAHQKDEYTDDGKLILHGRLGETTEYNFDEFRRIRSELLAIQTQLNSL